MSRKFVFVVFVAVFALALAGCPGAQQKDSSGEVGVKLRRVDITGASFEQMQLSIIVLVQNGTNADVGVSGGEGSLRIVGPAEHEDEGPEEVEEESDGEEEDADEDETNDAFDEDDEDDDDDDDEEEDSGADTTGIDTDSWVKGKAAGGSCSAFSECEIVVPVKLPLPKDSDALELLMSWQRMTVETKGTLKVGDKTETWGGPREIATPIMPRPILEEAQIASVDEGVKGTAFFKVGIDNPNVFQVKVDAFTWGITVGDKVMREPGDPSWENVPPSSVASFEDSVNLDEESFGKEVRKLLSQPSVSYVIEGRLEVRGIVREFRFDGEMEFAR